MEASQTPRDVSMYRSSCENLDEFRSRDIFPLHALHLFFLLLLSFSPFLFWCPFPVSHISYCIVSVIFSRSFRHLIAFCVFCPWISLYVHTPKHTLHFSSYLSISIISIIPTIPKASMSYLVCCCFTSFILIYLAFRLPACVIVSAAAVPCLSPCLR
jgi:hypothetical protein